MKAPAMLGSFFIEKPEVSAKGSIIDTLKFELAKLEIKKESASIIETWKGEVDAVENGLLKPLIEKPN